MQTLVGRFALGAGSVALSQTFDLGGQTVVLGAKHAVARMSLPRGRFQRALWARGDAAVKREAEEDWSR